MRTRLDIIRDLTAYGADAAPRTTMAEAALLIGALDRPALPLERYHRHLHKIAAKVGEYARAADGPVPVAVQVEALRQVLCRHYGYSGGDAEGTDADCFDLTRVIDCRDGASEALAIVFAETARRVGWSAEILHIPGRLLVRLQQDGERLIVDPLGDGRTVEAADMRAIVKAASGNDAELDIAALNPLDDKQALLRLLAGRKSMLLRAKRLEDAAELIDGALLVAPMESTLWRECGLLNARLERFHDAVAALEEYLRLGPGDNARYNTSILLQELRGRLS